MTTLAVPERGPPVPDDRVLFWLAVVMLVLVLLAMTIHSALAAPISMVGGTNYSFNYTNQSNETAVQDFLCVQNATNVSVVLQPGETRVTLVDACQVAASCAPAPTNVTVVNATCSIDTDLDPGEEYERRDGACNVQVSCREEDSLRTTVEHVKHYKISGDAQTITFEFDGTSQPFSRNSSTFSYEADVTYVCPVEVTKETFEGDELLELCKETNPYLMTWVDLALKRGYDCSDQKTACEESVSSCESQCTNRVGALNDRILTLSTTVNSTTTAFNTCVVEKQQVESRQWLSIAALIGLGLWAGMATVGCIVLGVILFKQRKSGGGEE